MKVEKLYSTKKLYSTYNLYSLYEDDDGHRYLIPINEELDFYKKLSDLEKKFDNYIILTPHEDTDYDLVDKMQQDIYDLLDKYDRLEGENYYVVLAEDLEK